VNQGLKLFAKSHVKVIADKTDCSCGRNSNISETKWAS